MVKACKRMLIVFGFICCVGGSVWAQETVTVSYQGPALIPDNPANTPLVLPIYVNRPLNITKVTVTLDIDHPNIGDLKITLVNPFGRTRKLADKNCNGTHNLTSLTFETSAPQRFGDACPSQSGQTFAPREEIDTWGGDGSLGVWYLTIEDDEDGRIGYLVNATLRITGTRPTAPIFNENSLFDAASYRRGPITPGEFTWITGAALGPEDVMTAQFDINGRLPTELGGVTVSFDGINAPINIAGLRAIQVQVPNEVAGRSSTTVVVRFQNGISPPVTVPVMAASPGLFTTGNAGSGQLAAINPDGRSNSTLEPVARGAYITVFANGIGATAIPVLTGQRAPSNPLSVATLPITASIGGQPAQVLYAGLAPGYVGLYQVNIAVPQNAPTGSRVLLTLTINGVPSQDDVFIVVK